MLEKILKELSLSSINPSTCTGTEWFSPNQENLLTSYSPVDGKKISSVIKADLSCYEKMMEKTEYAKTYWQSLPAPKRGEIIRQIGDQLREKKEILSKLVSYEMGKSLQEGLGEVQEMIDICDFSVGLARQLYGLSMHSERPQHRMYEQWHPLGVVGIISAFNFPVAVWAWNACIAAICGNVSVWKPSEKTPLTALATFHIMSQVLKKNNLPEGIFSLIIGDIDPIGQALISDKRINLVSATGSTRMGKTVASVVSGRFGKLILELGGNNAIIVTENANLKLAIPAIVFGAVGTAGQRCTTTRRLIVHSSIYDEIKKTLIRAYSSLKIGTPLDQKNHVGPLIDQDAVENMLSALKKLKKQGGDILFGGEKLEGKDFESGCYVSPALCEAQNEYAIVQEETFAPILYLIKYTGSIHNAIKIQNSVAQGLSSSVFTQDLNQAEHFLSHQGSDCGIANVNIGTSGAEIGGAFGGEKETGGGREAGSDSWRAYMRRQTNTINFGSVLPLAQGIVFDL